MSRGFVKEDDLEHAGTDLPERQISSNPNYVTTTGLRQLETLADELSLARTKLIQLKDNQSAIQKLAMVERDLRYVSARLQSAILSAPDTNTQQNTIVFGASVLVEDEFGEQHMFTIVGVDEADIKLNKVSWVSPIAKALIGQKVGDVVVWPRPAGNMTLEILKISYIN